MYIVSTNGGNELLVNADGRWFSTNCAPDGMFGDVDINADEMLKKLEKGNYSEAFASYGKILNSCNTCHLIIRNWK